MSSISNCESDCTRRKLPMESRERRRNLIALTEVSLMTQSTKTLHLHILVSGSADLQLPLRAFASISKRNERTSKDTSILRLRQTNCKYKLLHCLTVANFIKLLLELCGFNQCVLLDGTNPMDITSYHPYHTVHIFTFNSS